MLSQQTQRGWAVPESMNNTFSFSPPPTHSEVCEKERQMPPAVQENDYPSGCVIQKMGKRLQKLQPACWTL